MAESVSYGVTVATSVWYAQYGIRHRRGRGDNDSGLLQAAGSGSSSQMQGAGSLQAGSHGPQLEWTVPRYLGSRDHATYGVGLTFLRKTFGLCVACFGLTCCMTGGVLMLWGHGIERLVFTDVCTHYTHWSCTQWAVDGVLVLIIIPIKFCYGMMHGWTVPMLLLLAVFQSANLALLGCYSRSFAPIATQTFVTFWVALVTIWLACVFRERTLRADLRKVKGVRAAGVTGGSFLGDQRQSLTKLVPRNAPDDDCCCGGFCDWVGSNGQWSGWRDGWAQLLLYGTCSVLLCNFLLMLIKLWLDEPSTFVGDDGSGSDASRNADNWPDNPNADAESDSLFSREGNLRLIELLMGAPGLTLKEKLLDNGKVFVIAQLLTLFTVLEAKGAAKYCAPSEHNLAALFICPPGIPQILGCIKARGYQDFDEASSSERTTVPLLSAAGAQVDVGDQRHSSVSQF